MVNFEKLAALSAALENGNTDQARVIANYNGPLAKRADSAPAGWINSEGTSVPKPSKDDFYTFLTPEDVGKYELGDIIKHRQVGIYNATGINAWQLVYRSENSSGHAVGALTTIVVPEGNDGKHVVVYPQPEDSSFIDCASSYDLLTQGYSDVMSEILGNGWVLAIPDHEGFNSSFTAGVLEGKLTLDSIRAIEKSRDITGVKNDAYAVSGYSGGSIAAGWAAELQESYAPDLNIVAYAMGGFVNNLTSVIELVNKTPFIGFVAAGLMGLASEYTGLWDIYNSQSENSTISELSSALTQCTLADIVQFAGDDIFDYFDEGEAILQQELVVEILKNNTLRQHTPKVPMFIYNGVKDQINPVDTVDETVDYYCSNGADLVYQRGAGQDHIAMQGSGLPYWMKFFENAFNGEVPSGCSFTGENPDFAAQFTGSYNGFSGLGGNGTNGTSSNSTNGTSASASASASGSGSTTTSVSGSASASASASGSGSGSGSASGSARGSASQSISQNAGSLLKPASVGLISLLFSML